MKAIDLTKDPDKMSERELRNEVKTHRYTITQVMSVLTHDKIAERMEGLIDEDEEIDRYQLGVAVIAARKLVRGLIGE